MTLKNILTIAIVLLAIPQVFARNDIQNNSTRINGSVRVNINLELEQRVRELERTVRYMDQRLRAVEDIVAPTQPLPPAKPTSYTCMLVDSGYSKTFYAKAKSTLEAEYEVKQICSKTVHPSYCQKVTKCSSDQMDPYIKGYFCMITDSGYGKTFKGEGSDVVEAEAKAKEACQSSVHPSYCGNVQPRCEAYRN